eukprot:7626246-Pyramimonas_sp.AAC.1
MRLSHQHRAHSFQQFARASWMEAGSFFQNVALASAPRTFSSNNCKILRYSRILMTSVAEMTIWRSVGLPGRNKYVDSR